MLHGQSEAVHRNTEVSSKDEGGRGTRMAGRDEEDGLRRLGQGRIGWTTMLVGGVGWQHRWPVPVL